MIELLVLGFKGIHSALGFPGQDPYDMHSAALALEKLYVMKTRSWMSGGQALIFLGEISYLVMWGNNI